MKGDKQREKAELKTMRAREREEEPGVKQTSPDYDNNNI